jgi:uncharacterized lipoprotein
MPRFASVSIAILTLIGLGACNASPQPVQSASLQADDSASGTPPNYNLPPGAACTTQINRYATLVYGDNTTGMVSVSVFDEIKVEIAQAADTCRAGRDAEARGLVTASRRRHGYPSS